MGPIERSEQAVAAARRAISRLAELTPEVMGAALVGPEGSALAASGEEEAWSRAAAELLEAADDAAGQSAGEAHVGTEEAEALMVRSEGWALVAVAPRSVLSSLLAFDMRTVLREFEQAIGAEAP